LAKQFGVGDAALDGLKDPGRHPFPADQRAALLFADAMTGGPGEAPDEVFTELQRHFSEPQIVEIATVIGLFNYFNRFNNALHVEITLADPEVLLQRVREAVQAAAGAEDLCERVADILQQGRRYTRVGFYRRQENHLVLRASRGPAPPGRSFRLGEGNVGTVGQTGVTRAVDGELIVPIRTGDVTVGVIDVESSSAALDDEDRSLVERVAALLAGSLSASPA
jgi:putative methionine-R-sulfoxide reductase with GAF domain